MENSDHYMTTKVTRREIGERNGKVKMGEYTKGKWKVKQESNLKQESEIGK